MMVRLALASLRARALTVAMGVLAIALSVALVLCVDTVRTGAKASFADTISDTDLIVGARSGSVQLLLYTLFQIGSATNNVSWDSIQTIAALPQVEWLVPISLGDSHGEYRVMGTSAEFFSRYKFRGGQSLALDSGVGFAGTYDAVLGAEAAASLDYAVGDPLVLSHGVASFIEHEDRPFRVSGILVSTNTPLDRTVLVSLAGLEAIHLDWRPGQTSGLSATAVEEMTLTPTSVTAALVGVQSRLDIFNLLRWINDFPGEPLLAILPGLTLQEVWQLTSVAETALLSVAVMVVVTALMGLVAIIFSSLAERRREMAILRALGARPDTIVGLLMLEAVLMAGAGALLGGLLAYGGLWLARPWLDASFGIWLPMPLPGAREALLALAVTLAGALASLLPSARAYRMSLADGMSVRH